MTSLVFLMASGPDTALGPPRPAIAVSEPRLTRGRSRRVLTEHLHRVLAGA